SRSRAWPFTSCRAPRCSAPSFSLATSAARWRRTCARAARFGPTSSRSWSARFSGRACGCATVGRERSWPRQIAAKDVDHRQRRRLEDGARLAGAGAQREGVQHRRRQLAEDGRVGIGGELLLPFRDAKAFGEDVVELAQAGGELAPDDQVR